MIEADELITRRQAAAMTKFSPRTLVRWERLGLFPASIKVGGCCRYSLREIEAFIQALMDGRGETAWSRRQADREAQRAAVEKALAETKLARAQLEELAHAPRASKPRRPWGLGVPPTPMV
jgi:predicted DNA-binding transcriptional regulator AlpA